MSWFLEELGSVSVGFECLEQGLSELDLDIVKILFFSELSHISGDLFSFPPLVKNGSEDTFVKFGHLSEG